MSRGLVIAEQAKVVPIASGTGFKMTNARKASIIILGAATAVTVVATTDGGTAGEVAMPFNLYAGDATVPDQLGARIPVPASGYAGGAGPDVLVIEVDAMDVPDDHEWIEVRYTGAFSSVAILSGNRYGTVNSPTALA